MFEDASLARLTVRVNTAVRLVEEHTRLNIELEELLTAEPTVTPPQRAGARVQKVSPEVIAKTEEVEAIETRMEGSWIDVILQARPFTVWRDFQESHPPTDVGDDTQYDVNLGAVVTELLPECWIEPSLTAADWERALAGGLWPGDLLDLAKIVTRMHGRRFDVPKSRLTLDVRATLGALSERPARSGSPRGASTAGSPKSATTITTPTETTPATP